MKKFYVTGRCAAIKLRCVAHLYVQILYAANTESPFLNFSTMHLNKRKLSPSIGLLKTPPSGGWGV